MDPQSRAVFRTKDLKILYGGYGIAPDYTLYGNEPGVDDEAATGPIRQLVVNVDLQAVLWFFAAVLIALVVYALYKVRRSSAISLSRMHSPRLGQSTSHDDMSTLPPPATEKTW